MKLKIHAERADRSDAVDEVATLAYYRLLFGEASAELARMRVLRLCAAILTEFEDCFPDAPPIDATAARLRAYSA